jgi:tetratricopeptide (TPR) repeat protein
LEVLVLGEGFGEGMKEAKQRGGKKKKGKKKKADARVVEVLDACAALGNACNLVRDYDDSECYYKRAKDGYEKELGRNDEKTLRVTYLLMMSTGMSNEERIEKLRDLVERMKAALGEDNETTLGTLNSLGNMLNGIGDYEEARKVYEKCLLGKEKVLGEDHKKTLMTVNNLGIGYRRMKDYEKALEYFERALKGSEKTLGKTHPDTLGTVMNIGIVYRDGMKDYRKAEELYRRALEGYEAQLGKDNENTKNCAKNLAGCLAKAGERKRLRKVLEEYPHIAAEMGLSIDELCR